VLPLIDINPESSSASAKVVNRLQPSSNQQLLFNVSALLVIRRDLEHPARGTK
jgi:hypothetical protein